MLLSSKLLDDAVDEIAKLPGIGRKTALRMALHLLRQEVADVENLGNAIIKLRNNICFCKTCHNISDTDICEICATPKRDHSIICVVQDTRDVIAVENTSQYGGVYHVLGGIISPIDGIGPGELNIDNLISRVETGGIREVILALPTTVEGDTTNFYLFRKLTEHPVLISTIARGISIGDELEYTDEVTLGRSITNRLPYSGDIKPYK